MEFNWEQVKEALAQNDAEKIVAYKEEISKLIDANAFKIYLQRSSIQSAVAASWGDALLALQVDGNDLFAKFKLELLTGFAARHGLTAYTDVSQIQPGDTVVTKWKDKKQINLSHFRILAQSGPQWLVSLSMWECNESQFEAHKRYETINKKNFVVGVRQKTPPTMRKPHKFYFLNFND